MAEQHSSRGIMVATIVVTVILMAVVVPFSIKGNDRPRSADDDSREDVAARIQPVARFEMQKPAAAAAGGGAPKDGATVFNTVCAACHTTGAAGAPKVGEKGDWTSRLAKGTEVLYKNAIVGIGAMPPKGGGANLSEEEVKAAVDFMLAKVK